MGEVRDFEGAERHILQDVELSFHLGLLACNLRPDIWGATDSCQNTYEKPRTACPVDPERCFVKPHLLCLVMPTHLVNFNPV